MWDHTLSALWAKSSDNHQAPGHPVIAHLLDVAASAWNILELEPAGTRQLYADDLGLSQEEALRWVCALAGLHDLGKISPSFQQLWSPGWEHLLMIESQFDWRKGSGLQPQKVAHNWITQETLPDLLEARGFAPGMARGSGSVSDAVSCHHGYRAKSTLLETISNDDKGRTLWQSARQTVFETVLAILGVGRSPTVPSLSPAAFMRLAGLTSLADWIGSSLYPGIQFEGDLETYWLTARRAADHKLAEAGWQPRSPLMAKQQSVGEVFSYLSPARPFIPRPLQTTVENLLNQVTEPTLLLIEAPMGEGKTEAALYAHLRLQKQLDHRGLYVALPTMATGNSMFGRVRQFLEEQARQSNRKIPIDLQLAHGAAFLNREFQAIQRQIRPNTLQDQDDRVVAGAFFGHKKKALLSEYGVGTVDQALLAVLNVSHQFVRLWGLGNRVVVIDEVHAYDAYTSELIFTLVSMLKAMGSSVVLMSATLPADTRTKLLKAYGGDPPPTEAGYPRISQVSGGQTQTLELASDPNRQQTIQLVPLGSDLDSIVLVLEEQLSQGGCAVCIVNTVDRAQMLYSRLASFERYLFHARFPTEDRSAIEDRVLQKFGKDTSQRPHRAVLIATQVVEQSLDLDFDLMVSDLAPTDLLLQRAGRLWRHQRTPGQRPLPQATLYVAGLEFPGELPDLSTHYWDKVYDPYILYRTWEALAPLAQISLPEQIDPLVQQTYTAQEVRWNISEAAHQQILRDRELFKQETEIDLRDANNSLVVGQSWGRLRLNNKVLEAREEDELPNGRPPVTTRKGTHSITVIPLYWQNNHFFLDQAATQPYNPQDPLAAYQRSVKLTRPRLVGTPTRSGALEQFNRQQGHDQTFAHWQQQPLLRSCLPLILDSTGTLHLNTLTIRLNPELGVVYESQTS